MPGEAGRRGPLSAGFRRLPLISGNASAERQADFVI